ncbi:hypothetical protein NFE57_16250 [Hephaestia sp. MAHUQ-44]|nr:hypothetical protein [Hephaestia sp. MAHUQ-44]MCM8732514.1 hypothetical protein [Hephaestia sp. MAHUQ-44]
MAAKKGLEEALPRDGRDRRPAVRNGDHQFAMRSRCADPHGLIVRAMRECIAQKVGQELTDPHLIAGDRLFIRIVSGISCSGEIERSSEIT